MPRCNTCEYPIPDDRERVGARCPSCHDPIYEPAGRIARPAREGEASCGLHEGMESVGVCLRCGSYVCETCRTRWRGQILCAACVTKALAGSEATPGQQREQRRQAITSVVCGTAAWLVAGVTLVMLSWLGPSGGRAGVVVTFFAFLVVAGNALLGAVGAGQAVAALRVEGRFRAMAWAGLVLSGLYAGVVLGTAALGLWQN